MCPYLFLCSFDLSVWYQVLFDMICLQKTSFCIICSFLFGLPFLYLLVLNFFQLFFVCPFLFQFHPCFLCFSLSIVFSFCIRQRVFQFWSTHFSSSSSFVFLWSWSQLLSCITLFTSIWQLVQTKLATNTKAEANCQSYWNFEKFLFAVTFLSVLLKLLKLTDCLRYSVSEFWIYRVFIG